MGAEDTPNLKLSWEVTWVAKIAFQKMAETLKDDEKKEAEAKYCEAVMVLGEISLENEDFTQAVDTLCLEKRKKILPEDSRLIAETCYELGMALGSLDKFSEAQDSFRSAILVLKARIKNIGSTSEEVKDLESLIAEIEPKIGENVAKGKMEEVASSSSAMVGAAEGVCGPPAL